MMKHTFLMAFFATITMSISAQVKYSIDASFPTEPLKSTHFIMGNPGSSDKEIVINSQYLTIGGKPFIPVMGEMHLTRVPRKYWEETLLKMKAGGVTIIAFYVFWNHHEEIEGQFNWSGNNDVRAFVKLCQKHDLYAYPRIGPWGHGEARNGGFPDWLLLKTHILERSNHPVYQNYAKRFYHEIAIQLQGLYYKNDGPVIGIQLENEYGRAKEGESHIKWLKETAVAEGMDVPLYTVTGWGGGSVPPFEVVPLWGAYPDAPWADHIHREISEENFCFDLFRNNEKIGDEANKSKPYMTYSQYPYFTCEMGIGVQNTYMRRLVIGSKDGLALATAKLGSGSNLIGYYVFAGGSNPQGVLHSQTEEKEETGYWNHNPDKSYDFQAAIRETGETSDAYREVKKMHYFLADFGAELAPATPILVPRKANEMQLAVRSFGNSGFLFGINYCRYIPRDTRKNVRFELKLPGETLTFPQTGVTIADSSIFIWPFNLKINTINLKYATAQPLCKLKDMLVFFSNTSVRPEFCFDSENISSVIFAGKNIVPHDSKFMVTVDKPGKDALITIYTNDGKVLKCLVLSELEAKQAWVFNAGNQKEFYLSNADLFMNDGKLNLITKTATTYLFKLGTPTNFSVSGKQIVATQEGQFTRYVIENPLRNSVLNADSKSILADVNWLQSNNAEKLVGNQSLFHRFFIKEFSLENTSRIRSAKIYLVPESECRLNVNNRWVTQNITPSVLNELDITGYVDKGENNLYLDFPLTNGQKAFAARVIVEYYNTQHIEFSSDRSWLTKDAYSYPTVLIRSDDYGTPKVVTIPNQFQETALNSWKEWRISVPNTVFDGAHATYLTFSYTGDVARIYNGFQLVADNFNSNTPWRIALNRLDFSPEGRDLQLIITPSHYTRIFQDIPTSEGEMGKALIRDLKVESDYQVVLEK